MVNIKPTIEIYDSEGDLTKAYSKAFDKMNDVTMDVDLSQFDFDEVYKGKCKEFDDLVTKLCKQSGLGSSTIYALLLTRFTDEDEYLMDYDVMYTYGLDELEESKKSAKRSLKESKESNLIEKVAVKLKDEKIINGTIDTFRGADWFTISGKDSTIKVIYMRGELSIELYQNGEFKDGELEKASSLSDDDFSVNYVIDFIKNFLKVTKFNKNEFSIKESLKESNYDLINDDLLAMCKGLTKQLIYAMDDYQSNYSDKSLKELKRRIEEVEDLCDKILYQINKR